MQVSILAHPHLQHRKLLYVRHARSSRAACILRAVERTPTTTIDLSLQPQPSSRENNVQCAWRGCLSRKLHVGTYHTDFNQAPALHDSCTRAMALENRRTVHLHVYRRGVEHLVRCH